QETDRRRDFEGCSCCRGNEVPSEKKKTGTARWKTKSVSVKKRSVERRRTHIWPLSGVECPMNNRTRILRPRARVLFMAPRFAYGACQRSPLGPVQGPS